MRFDLDVNDRAARELLDGIADRAGDPKPVLRRCAAIISRGIAKNVQSQGAYLDARWPALAASTVTRKAREGMSGGILDAEGTLFDSLLGGTGHVFSVTKTQARVGTKSHIARFHQGGTKQGMPKRVVVGVAKNDRSEIFRLLRDYLVGS